VPAAEGKKKIKNRGGPSLLEEEETRGQRGVAGLCFWRRRRWRGKKKKGGYGAGLSSFLWPGEGAVFGSFGSSPSPFRFRSFFFFKEKGAAAEKIKFFRVSLFVAPFNCQIAPIWKFSVAWYL